MTHLLRSAAALLLAPLAAGAQPAAPPPTAAAPAAAAAPATTLFGELRTRGEWDRSGTPVDADAVTLLRARVGLRVAAASNTRVVLEVQDSRMLGAGGAAAARVDLHQGYVELAAPWHGLTVAARAGRQEIALGNERLVGAVNWSNTGRAFDGGRVLVAPAGDAPRWTATAFAATVEERGRRSGAATPAPDHAVAGLYATRALGRGALDVTLLHDVGDHYRAYDDARRTTLDLRLRTAPVAGVRVDLEGAVQVGAQRYVPTDPARDAVEQDVRAWLVAARLATMPIGARAVTATLGVDALSGDDDPTDGRYGAFATMYATNHPYYGLMDVVGEPAATTREHGLVDAFAAASVALAPRVGLRGELHRLALATGDVRPLGWEGDVVLPVRVGATAGLELGYAAFRPLAGAPAHGLGAEGRLRQWAYLQLRAGF